MKDIVNHKAVRGGIVLRIALLGAALGALCASAVRAETPTVSPQDTCAKLTGTFIAPTANWLPTSGRRSGPRAARSFWSTLSRLAAIQRLGSAELPLRHEMRGHRWRLLDA